MLDDLPADKMFLNDPFEHVWIGRMVPDPVRPDQRNRPGGANLQAICLGALYAAASPTHTVISFWPRKPKLLEPLFEKFPRALSFSLAAAFLLFTKGAKKNVPFDGFAANLCERSLRFR